ncbi:uncharacterized protein si:dkey-106l3.7 isoform X2 [Megalops cyprinoides]|uniref:uncharacterized protein si:dkey-106l3.7 isoform X2 n=1 Tax=Megalops cyprinoides TaxID=118141 RepID=UPI001863F4AD|nr:uncharacterized protein si:dkey-106l3.7 isoform X2 [Megalops cyprinoides]
MNLYRNFGSLMETWATNAHVKSNCEDMVGLGNEQVPLGGKVERRKDWMPKELVGTILRSESEDSGVEMASIETENAPSTPHGSVSSFLSIKEEEMCTTEEMGKVECRPSSPPSSYDLSSRSSSSSSLNTVAQEKSKPLSMGLKVEQALWRADRSNQRVRKKSTISQSTLAPSHYREDSDPLDPCHMAPLLLCHSLTSESRIGQRSGSLGARRTAHPPASIHRRGNSLKHLNLCPSANQVYPQLHCEEEVRDAFPTDGISPGLGYLEQVCRLLEEIARLQTSNKELRRENERVHSQLRVQSCQDMGFTQHTSCNMGDDLKANQTPDIERHTDPSSQSTHEDEFLHPCLRRRSMSDTKAFIRHVGGSEMQSQWNVSTGDLLDQFDRSTYCQPGQKQQHRMNTLDVKLKTGSLKSNTVLEKPSRPKRPFRLLFKKRTKNVSVC